MSGGNHERTGAGIAIGRSLVVARGAHVHDKRMEDLPESWLDEGSAAPRHMRFAWEEAAKLREHPGYQDLLGTPTLRERVVAFRRSLGERMRLPPAPAPRWALAGIAAAAILAGAWALRPHQPDYATRIAEIRDIPLADGSVVTLGARSALDVDFTARERTVRLGKGEAFFSVSHNAARPFVVLAGGERIRVVGTRFNVNYDGSCTRISVLQGVVEVSHGGAGVRLVAGQQLVMPEGGAVAGPEPLRGSEPGAWRSGRLDYRDASLAEIVSDANRYYAHPIRIASPSLAGERLTTSFRTSQIDQMLETLPASLPIRVERAADGTVSLERSAAPTG